MALVRTALTTLNSTTGVTSYNNLANSLTAVASSAAVTVGATTNIADHEVVVTITGPATMTASASTLVLLYAYASNDGTIWSGSGTTNELIDGADKPITWSANGNQAVPLGSIGLTTTTAGTSVVYRSKRISMAAAFGGTLPAKYVILIQNQSSGALAGSGNSVAINELSYS